MINDIDLDNIMVDMDKKEKIYINEKKNKNCEKKNTQENNNKLDSESDEEEFKTYVFYDTKEKNKYLFTAHKVSKN